MAESAKKVVGLSCREWLCMKGLGKRAVAMQNVAKRCWTLQRKLPER